jgi:gas vesicle protein
VTALGGLALLLYGAAIGAVLGAGAAWLSRDREARAEVAEVVRKANAALDALADELAVTFADECDDWTAWKRECGWAKP